MARWFIIIALLLGGCAAEKQPEPYLIPYNGYGPGAAKIVRSGQPTGQSGHAPAAWSAGDVTVSNIDLALDTFLSPAGDELILLPNRLHKSQLDFSLESLKVVDDWLKDIHTINRLQADQGRAGESLISDGRGDNSVMFAGLYLGEVIRANSDLEWTWQRFDTFIAANPYFSEHYGFDPGLDSFVLVGPQGVATPINTALKRVLVGKEESLHFIGMLLMNPVDLESAVSGQNFFGLTDIR
ncbi:hypothetical protein WNY37_11240 [Henriciella sp. AS95]|uniref:hypothetical protein n=1 Tax=Henriciella sp. AS95 TaxID=3135782 RepID=UPI00317693ED